MKSRPDMVLDQIKQHVASGGDVHEALYAYYDLLKKSIPAERMSLLKVDFERRNILIIAQASDTGSEKTGFLFSVPEEIFKGFQTENLPEIYIINEPEKDPVGKNVIKRAGVRDWSLIGMRIKEDNVIIGGIFFTVKGRNKYSKKHVDFLTGLSGTHKWFLDAVIADYENRSAGPDRKEPVEDKYEFFRQVTRRLCGHLDLETGVLHCLQYLSRFIPAAMLSVHKHRRKTDRDVIGASPTGWFNYFDPQMINLDTESLSPAKITSAHPALIINQPEGDPNLRALVDRFGSDWSVLAMFLLYERVPLGMAVLVSEGRSAFTEEHRQLFSMLHDPFSLALSNHIKHREVIRLKNIIEDEKRNLQEEMHFSREAAIVGGTSGLKGVLESARVVAGRNSPVLLSGETGVGKEIIANFIHRQSARKDGPMIKVNCGAIPDSLVDSELFGHEKGAFTGADTLKKGRFERADGGTVFLDEVAELPLSAQVRMLRVLQHKIIERVGGTGPIPVDIRVIAATHRNLEELVAEGRFREDLWFRLNVLPVHIPPLRSRRSDIPALVNYFIEKKSREMNLHVEPSLSSDAMERLIRYDWPGNVRELENVIERELILKNGAALTFQNMVPSSAKKMPLDNIMTKEDIRPLDEVYTRYIQKVLKMTSGKISGPGGAAEKLKIKPGTLRKRMDKLGIPYGWKREE
ncbi:MAG: sigma-54 dependent transcriptional regulator [Thermodesulfobacteriota bacterium]